MGVRRCPRVLNPAAARLNPTSPAANPAPPCLRNYWYCHVELKPSEWAQHRRKLLPRWPENRRRFVLPSDKKIHKKSRLIFDMFSSYTGSFGIIFQGTGLPTHSCLGLLTTVAVSQVQTSSIPPKSRSNLYVPRSLFRSYNPPTHEPGTSFSRNLASRTRHNFGTNAGPTAPSLALVSISLVYTYTLDLNSRNSAQPEYPRSTTLAKRVSTTFLS